MTTDLRVLRLEEWDSYDDLLLRTFHEPGEPPWEREMWRAVVEPERFLAAWDGPGQDDEQVGTAGSFGFRMTVPGGNPVPAAGITMVTVAATHRRQGVLTAMMRRQLDDIRAAGTEPLAVLHAAEPAIYGRFGYGIASERLSASIDTSRVRLTAPLPAGTDTVRLRYADPEAVLADCEALYARLVATRPGMLARPAGWEQRVLNEPGTGSETRMWQCVTAERDGALVGYVRFSVQEDWDVTGPRSRVVVGDLDALDPGAYTALLRFLFGIDLTSWVDLRSRPVDDPFVHLVDDIRRCELRVHDQAHVRLVEVGAALEARAYAAPVDVVFEVEDAFCPWNTGRWRLSGDTKGASCARTTDPADLALTVRELGAAYLGGPTLAALGAAGRVDELRSGALAEASLAFRSETAPSLSYRF